MTDVELRLTADLSSATREVSGFRKEYAELVRAVEKPLRQVDALQQTQDNAKKAAAEFYAAKTAVEQLKKAAASAGQPIQGLNQELARAERVLARTTLEFDRQKAKVREQRTELRAAGVDTHNLATEQQRLQAEMAAGLGAGRSDLATQGIRAKAAALAQVTREQRLANLEQARADFGINRARQYETELVRLRNQYQLLRASGSLTNRELSIAQRAYTQRVLETKTAMGALVAEQKRMSAGGAMLPGLVSGVGSAYAVVAAIKNIAAQSDAYSLMNARLKLATGSQEEFNTASSELRRIATATQAPLESMVTLYGRISRPLKEAGRSQADILKVTEAVAQSFRISGASSQEAQNGVIQFAQALGSGALRGDEFNSVAEQAPRLMQALAAGIGVPVSALKEMASQGELTAAVVTTALTGQLEVLRSEALSLPDTVGGAMTELADTWNQALGSINAQPLIDALKEMNEVAKEPSTSEGIGLLSAAVARLGTLLVQAGADFAGYGQKIGAIFAAVTGGLTALDAVDLAIKEIEKTLARANVGLPWLHAIPEQVLKDQLKFFKGWREDLSGQQAGLNDDLRLLGEIASGVADASRQAEIDAQTKYVDELKTLQAQQLKDAEKAIKEQQSLQKKAQADKDKIATDRKAIDAKYDETKATLSGAGSGSASYAGAQALKVNARASLQAGDSAGAIKQAEAARKVLLDLQAAGENTYGFAGFADELRSIEQAAKDIEDTEADRKLLVIGMNIAVLQSQADKLKDIKVTPVMDDAAATVLTTAMQDLATSLGNTLTIPVKMVAAGFVGDMNSLALQPSDQVNYPGFSPGGWTGPGDKYKPAGVVHADEHVQPKRVVNEPGALSFLEQIRRNGYRNTMASLQARMATTVRGYAEGGLVMPSRAMPSIPQISPALLSQGSPGRDLGRVDLNIGGETISLLADQQNFTDLVKRQSWKRGSTRR